MTRQGQYIVIGAGVTGSSVARWLVARGESVVIHDTRPTLPAAQLQQLHASLPGVSVQCGPLNLQQLRAAEQVIVSPGVPLSTPELRQLAEEGIPLPGDVELFARHCGKPVIAITGSNGKSTVTTLVAELAKAAGINAVAGGNLGTPALDLLAGEAELYVLELSSFQLETTWSLQPVAATILNVSPDHLDRYSDLDAYAQAKQRVYLGARQAITNRQDPRTMPQQVLSTRSFGTDRGVGTDWGLQRIATQLWLVKGDELIIAANELQLLGIHNLLNIQAALALLEAADIDWRLALDALRQFNGLPHRCQYVPTDDGVTWVDDSKATNEGSTLAAIAGVRPLVSGRLILLAGGDGKGTDFAMLRPALANDIDLLLTFGRDGALLAELKPGSQLFDSMAEAVAWLRPQLQSDDWVLLAPACASLDQFSNYRERGAAFIALAQGGDV